MKSGTGKQYLRTIQVYNYSTTETYLVSKEIEIGEKKRKIKAIMPFKVIQGHRGGYQSKAHIVTDILSRTVSEISQLLVQILDTLRF